MLWYRHVLLCENERNNVESMQNKRSLRLRLILEGAESFIPTDIICMALRRVKNSYTKLHHLRIKETSAEIFSLRYSYSLFHIDNDYNFYSD